MAMRKYQIFVSSTYNDLVREREVVIKAILEMGNIPVGMEMFSAADEEQWKLIARQIQESDYYVVIIAHRYGSTVEGVSYTEKEYDFAVSQGIPVLGFVIAESAAWPADRFERSASDQITRFKAKVQSKPVNFWTSADDLHGKVAISLMKQFATTPRPGWIRSTEAIDPTVVNELTRLSEENHRLRDELERRRSAEAFARLPDLEETLTIRFKLTSTSAREQTDRRSVDVTWHEILSRLGSSLLRDRPENAMPELLRYSVARTLQGLGIEVRPEYIDIESEDFRKVTLELLAHGLIDIKVETRQSPKGPYDFVRWSLTKQGRVLLLEKRDRLFYRSPAGSVDAKGPLQETPNPATTADA
jgi:hypothetical protein